MPTTRARTSPPSGLLSCSVLAAFAPPGRRPDAATKAMVRMILNARRMARYLSEIGFTSLTQGFRDPGLRTGYGPGAPRGRPGEGLPRRTNVCRQRPAGGSPSCGARLLRTSGRRVRILIGARGNRRRVLRQGAEPDRNV